MAILPLSVLLFCALESFIITESASSSPSELPKRYSTILLQSSNGPNFTLLSETETDLKVANHENISWQSRAFQVTNISTLLTNYQSLSFPPLNNSRFFNSENPASLTVVIKNFSGFLLSLNFSYYIGNNNEVTNAQLPTASQPYKTSSVEESEKYRANNEEESKKLAMAIVAEPVTKLLTTSIVNAMKQNLILATKQQQQQAIQEQQTSSSASTTPETSSQSTSERSIITSMVHPTLEPNPTTIAEPMVVNGTVNSQNAVSNNAPVEMPSTLLTNNNSLQNSVKAETILEPEATVMRVTEDETDSVKSIPATTEKIETFSHSTESSNDNVSLNSDNDTETTTVSVPEPELPEPEPKTMTQDVARKRRSVSTDDSGANTPNNKATIIETQTVGDTDQESKVSEVKPVVAAIVNEQTQADNMKEKSSIASEDSMPALPVHLDAIIKTAAAVVAAAATSGQITKTGPTISDAPLADNPKLNLAAAAADEHESYNAGTASIKETDSTSSSSSSSATGAKPENTIRKTHSHHRHKSKSNLATEHSLDSHHHHHDRNRKTKKADNAERGEKDGVVGSNDEGDVSSSSSSSSEEDAEHGDGVKKISYKTWRASLEKRNRPPGLFVTVNDNIIFDNWEGIWDKPNVLGKWTGGLKSASKTKWNQSYISTNWEDATEHDVKITFEWEPIHENAFVILSDIVVSTIAIPLPLCSEPNKPDILTKKDNDVKIEATEKPEQAESPILSIDTPLNATVATDANVVETDASTTHNLNEHVEGSARERQVLKLMQKIGNDETEAERIAHEIMKNLTAKESDDVSLESVLRKLPYNIKEALLLHAQRVLTEESNELRSSPIPTTSDATTTPSTTQSTDSSTTASSTTASTTASSTTLSTTPSTTTLSTTISTTTAPTPSTTTPSTTIPSTTTESPTTTSTQKSIITFKATSSESSMLRESKRVEPVQSTANKRPARKTDNLTALGVCIFTGVVFAGLLGSVVWKKVQLQRKGRNATR